MVDFDSLSVIEFVGESEVNLVELDSFSLPSLRQSLSIKTSGKTLSSCTRVTGPLSDTISPQPDWNWRKISSYQNNNLVRTVSSARLSPSWCAAVNTVSQLATFLLKS